MSDRIAAIDLQRFALDDLNPHPRNPREHPDPASQEWEVLKRSLSHAYFDPLVYNRRNKMLVSGHLRQKLLKELGYTHADVSVVDFDEATHLAVMIAANKHGGDFDPILLASLAKDIDAAGLDAALAGFEEKAFMGMIDCPEVPDDSQGAEELLSKADELQAKWQVKVGEVFQVGIHKVMCGDCASHDNWQRLAAGQLLDGIWTDPVYNVDYGGVQARRKRSDAATGGESNVVPQDLVNDHLPAAEFIAKLRAWFTTAASIIKPGGAIYVAHADLYSAENRQALVAAGFYVSQCLVWVKTGFTLTRHDYHYQHEPVLYGWREGAAHYFQGGYSHSSIMDGDISKLHKKSKPELMNIIRDLQNARDTTVIREPRSNANELHPTIKPVPLVARHVWNSSRRGETWGEMFLGSGTTLIACERVGRRCLGLDIDPKYVAVTLERASGLGLPIEKENVG